MKKKDKYKRMKPEANSRLTDIVDGGSLKKHLKLGKVSPYMGTEKKFKSFQGGCAKE